MLCLLIRNEVIPNNVRYLFTRHRTTSIDSYLIKRYIMTLFNIIFFNFKIYYCLSITTI